MLNLYFVLDTRTQYFVLDTLYSILCTYSLFDRDGNGTVSVDELALLMKMLGFTPNTDRLSLLAYDLRLTTYYMLPTTCYLLLATYYLLPATCYLLLATYYLLPATCYLLLATGYLLPTTYCS